MSVKYKARVTVTPRRHVYVVRLDDDEMAGLQAISKRRGLPISDVIRQFARTGLRLGVA